MKNSHIRIEYGGFSVTFDGSEEFIERALPQLISDIGQRLAEFPATMADGPAKKVSEAADNLNLPDLIRRKSNGTQVGRFLVTAVWLQARGTGDLTTGAVAKALKDHNQKRLGNASDCLNTHISNGNCERRDGKKFHVTPDGMRSVGLEGHV